MQTGWSPSVSRAFLCCREGHYGLPGMRERATLIGGKLTIWSEVDAGSGSARSCQALSRENRCIYALSVIPHPQPEALIVITDFDLDLRCLRVQKGVSGVLRQQSYTLRRGG
jgi:hypothetical protein